MLGWEVLNATVMTVSFVSCDTHATSHSLQLDSQGIEYVLGSRFLAVLLVFLAQKYDFLLWLGSLEKMAGRLFPTKHDAWCSFALCEL